MLTPLSTYAAFRVDLNRHPGRASVSVHDYFWILTSSCFERLSEISESEARDNYAQSFASQLLSGAEAHNGFRNALPKNVFLLATQIQNGLTLTRSDDVFDRAIRVVEDMESAGVLQLAYSILGFLRRTWPTMDAGRQGLTLAIQGRIAREVGELEQAREIYQQLVLMSEASGLSELAAQAVHGLGGVALARGNLPEARNQYSHALHLARRAGSEQLQGRAHRGLLIVAAKEGNYEEAINHGWAAFERTSEDRNAQAELLGNLGGLFREMREYPASLQCYAVALQRTDAERIRLPSLGGAALAAAYLGNANIVSALAKRIKHEVSGGAQPFNAAQTILDLAVAFETIGMAVAANELAEEAETLSVANGYFELEHLAGELKLRVRRAAVPSHSPAPVDVAASTRSVIKSIATLAGEESSISALAETTE
jgi:tetratricopeptide (TPR) repeat protein